MELTKTKYKQTEIGLIPEEWEVRTIGEIANVKGGGTPSTRISNYWNGTINWFTPTEIGQNKYVNKSKRKITAEGLNSSSAQLLPIGTILLTSRAGIGDLAILKKESSTNQGFQSLIANEDIDYEFLYYLMLTSKNKLLEKASGSTFLEISPNNVRSIQLLIPSFTEQKAIAEVLSDVDSLIQAIEQKLAKKRAIKQGAMQKLLTPPSRTSGQGKEDWEVKKLGEIAEFFKGKGLPKSEIIEEGKYKCLHYGELFTKYKEEITDIISKTDSKKNRFVSVDNDVLMPTSDVTPNGLATASCIKEEEVILGGDILVIRIPKNIIEGTFLSYSIVHNREQVMQLVTGSTVYHLYGSDMAKFELGFPNIEEQIKIASILMDMDKEIELIEQQLAKYQVLKHGLMQELLTGRIRITV